MPSLAPLALAIIATPIQTSVSSECSAMSAIAIQHGKNGFASIQEGATDRVVVHHGSNGEAVHSFPLTFSVARTGDEFLRKVHARIARVGDRYVIAATPRAGRGFALVDLTLGRAESFDGTCTLCDLTATSEAAIVLFERDGRLVTLEFPAKGEATETTLPSSEDGPRLAACFLEGGGDDPVVARVGKRGKGTLSLAVLRTTNEWQRLQIDLHADVELENLRGASDAVDLTGLTVAGASDPGGRHVVAVGVPRAFRERGVVATATFADPGTTLDAVTLNSLTRAWPAISELGADQSCYGFALLAVPDQDGDALADFVVTAPRAFFTSPACVISSADGRRLQSWEMEFDPYGLAVGALDRRRVMVAGGFTPGKRSLASRESVFILDLGGAKSKRARRLRLRCD